MTHTYTIIKECIHSHKKCAITTNCYGSSLRFIDELFDEAKKDFPTLERNDVEVVKYGGRIRKQMYGLEFMAPGPVPASYFSVEDFEPLLA